MGTRWQHDGPRHVSIEYIPHGHLVLEKSLLNEKKGREVLYPRDVLVTVVPQPEHDLDWKTTGNE